MKNTSHYATVLQFNPFQVHIFVKEISSLCGHVLLFHCQHCKIFESCLKIYFNNGLKS
jgi:hypothetical protein